MALQIYEWLIQMFLDILLILVFLFILLHPLWKLSKTRRAIIIVFSRAIGSVFRLCSEMSVFIFWYIFGVRLPLYNYLMNVILTFFDTVLAIHILALAVNRAHAIIFPFHYNFFSSKKRNFYLLCTLLWLFSSVVGPLDQSIKEWTNKSINLYQIVHKISIGIGAICYVALTYKLIRLKYKKSSTNGTPSNEKDSIRILIVCFSCLFMASLRCLIIDPISKMDWTEIPKMIFNWLNFLTGLLAVCTEEICLLFLVKEFQKDVEQQFRQIFCYFTKRSSFSTSAVMPFSYKQQLS